MGFFGGQTRQDPATTPSFEEDTFEEAFDALPTQPQPQDKNVISKGKTLNRVIYGEGIFE